MRQQDGFSHENGYRASSPNSQLPSLHTQLLRHRQDDMETRPSRRHADDGSMIPDPWVVSQPVVDPFVPGVIDTLPPLQPSLSWSDDSSTFSDPSPRNGTDPDPKRKRPRFLGDIDRRIIIQRLENGEKQANLAREFGVTRAAICHINKNRDEILTRFDILAKSPQGRQMIQNYVYAPHVMSLVRELRMPNVSVLLTRLRGGNTSPAVFKSTADRLMSILIEEALVSFGTKAVGVQDLLGSNYDGKEYARPVFALSVAEDGEPFLRVFAAMEPANYRGFVALDSLDGGRVVRHIDLPPNASEANAIVCLTSLSDVDTMRVVLKALESRGVKTSRLCIVCMTASEACINQIAVEFRDAKILAACITKAGADHALDTFVSRWTAPLSQ